MLFISNIYLHKKFFNFITIWTDDNLKIEITEGTYLRRSLSLEYFVIRQHVHDIDYTHKESRIVNFFEKHCLRLI